ncbi:hypothetical protein DEO72_LG11g1742 [Vigna unguiculata]|uniref:Uncharacterized protein n=1 Tax=Vigna unguiculata TaxID=3917 RepID=A0A4D6NSJ3_VIGUN|nr:hypothetical protein DEO72_LG11g1742 [Vigna unguiculata]
MEMQMAMTIAPLLPALAHPRWCYCDAAGAMFLVQLRAVVENGGALHEMNGGGGSGKMDVVAAGENEEVRNLEEDARWRVAAAMADCSGELTVNGGDCRHGGGCHGDGRRGGKLGLGFHV